MREDTQLQAIIPDYRASRTLGKNPLTVRRHVRVKAHLLDGSGGSLAVLAT
jgi:hypothetical protein